MKGVTKVRDLFEVIYIKGAENWKPNDVKRITRKSIVKISLSSMYYSCRQNGILMPTSHVNMQDMASAERERFDEFMSFTAQVVQKYGNFIM